MSLCCIYGKIKGMVEDKLWHSNRIIRSQRKQRMMVRRAISNATLALEWIIESHQRKMSDEINNLCFVLWLLRRHMIPNYFCQKSFHWKQLQLEQSWWHQHEQIYPLALRLVVMVKQALPIRVDNQIRVIWSVVAVFTERQESGFSVQSPDYIPSSSSIIGW